MKRILIYWLFALSGLAACQSRLSRGEYVAWIQDYDNGLRQRKEAGEYVFEVQHKPAVYKLIVEGDSLPKEHLEKEVREIEELQYYDLSISIKGAEVDLLNHNAPDQQTYQQKSYYFSYDFARDIYLEEDGKKLPCELFHFERSYDLKKTRTFMLAFANQNPQAKHRILVIESELLGDSPVKIEFETKALPQLNL